MLFKHVFWAADWMGFEHEYAIVLDWIRFLQDVGEAFGIALYSGGKCVGADGGWEYGDYALRVRVCGCYACTELYAEEGRARTNILKSVEAYNMGAGFVFLWCGIRSSSEETGNYSGEAKISFWHGYGFNDRSVAWKGN
jgi:hypothetical protein